MNFRIGHGYDVHRLVPGRRLVLGGVTIPYEYGLAGHSDADVLIHAVCDALLGAAALGDIGAHFPDTDSDYLDIDSRVFLRKTAALLQKEKYCVGNVDATVIAQKPKLARYIGQMREKLAADLGIPVNNINIKATTEESLGFTGDGSGIAAHAVCIIENI